MAAIRETLILEDKFTSTMTQCLQVAQRMANMLDDVRASTMNVETAAAATAVQMQELAGKMTQTNSRGTSLLGTIRNLAGTFLGMQSVRWLVNTSDQLTSINARLRLMTGSAEAAAAAQEEIYQAAMRSRGAYADMADFVSQLGTVAGNAFTGTDELVAFAEQIQKQMAISGASGASAQAALVQLTQGLASGTLRGEELNSVLEQTPMIAQTIAEYMGVTIGEMRELASEGKVTAEVVKNAMLGEAEETNAQFEQMPMTWAQVWTMFQNVAIQALDPVLDAISWLANNIDLVGPIVLGLAIGCMCAFDMGGPVNKAAYATGTFLLGTALEAGVGTETYNFGTNFMAAVSAACIVPPLITTFAVVVGKKYFSQEDHDAGIVNLILGCTHITEGAIPFMTKNIWPVMPIMMLGSSIASILTIFFNVHDPAPHGGFLVLPVVENGPLWVLAILIGAVVGGILFVAFKKYDLVRIRRRISLRSRQPIRH